eukprot:Phypoly_transcript_06786.p1 GENE.Phypoly_transcript_06786~~Phypoly_transcript_06786.p1  ORF type:complete len:560 (+),score=89.62 Phypoly_transcript_06786:30-1709(+)
MGKGDVVVTNADSLYVIEYAITKDSVCKGFSCPNQAIALGDLRIGKLGASKYGNTKYGTEKTMIPKWYHASCMFEELAKARASTHIISSPDDFRAGWDPLKKADKEKVQKLIETMKDARKGNAKGKQKKTKNKKKDESDSEEEKPTKKKLKKDQKTARPSEALVQAALPVEVWTNVLSFLEMPEILQCSLISHICCNAGRQALFKHRGITIVSNKTYGPVPDSFAAGTEKMKVDSSYFKNLAQFTNLTSLHVCGVYDSSFTKNLVHLTKVTNLILDELSFCHAKENFIDILKTNTNLTSLYISGCQSVVRASKTWIEDFSQLPNLTSLAVRRTLDDPFPPPFSWGTSLKNLTSLDLRGNNLGDWWIPVLEQFPTLTSFGFEPAVRSTKFDFSKLPNIKTLKIVRMELLAWKNLILPPALVTLKTNIPYSTSEIFTLPPIPATLRKIHLKNGATVAPKWQESTLEPLTNGCKISISFNIDLLGSIPSYVFAKLHSLTLTIRFWPKHKRVLDALENLPNQPLPPILVLKYSLDNCSYKKKVKETIEQLKEKANILLDKCSG